MANIAEIDKAIGAHGMWKSRLRTAIDTGKTDMAVDAIRQDSQCPFGKWLYGSTIAPADKASSHFKSVTELHAQFHKSAGRVAELAVAGKKAEADALLAPNGEFTAVSAKLTQAMMEWKKVSK